jgi:hypothetical protein
MIWRSALYFYNKVCQERIEDKRSPKWRDNTFSWTINLARGKVMVTTRETVTLVQASR